MGRRSNHSREEIQHMVIIAARDIVATEGSRELSTRKIATRIGYTVGTLYHFFKNLDDIILHVNADTLDKLALFLEEKMKSSPLKNLVHTLAYGYLEFCKTHPSQWQLLFEYPISSSVELPSRYEEKMDKLFELVALSLQRELNLPQHVLPRASRVLWAGIHGICALSISGKLLKTKTDTETILVDDFITYYLAGLKQNT